MTPPSLDLLRRAAAIKLLLTDVDGVWTDGGLYYVPGVCGEMVETKRVGALDGQGFRWWHAAGLHSGVISGRDSPGIVHRAEMLGISYVYQGCLEKIAPYHEIVADAGIGDHEVCYIGDDLPDAPLLRRAGLGVAVDNARPEVKAEANYVTEMCGGQGAIREVIELVLKAQDRWDMVLNRYGIAH